MTSYESDYEDHYNDNNMKRMMLMNQTLKTENEYLREEIESMRQRLEDTSWSHRETRETRNSGQVYRKYNDIRKGISSMFERESSRIDVDVVHEYIEQLYQVIHHLLHHTDDTFTHDHSVNYKPTTTHALYYDRSDEHMNIIRDHRVK